MAKPCAAAAAGGELASGRPDAAEVDEVADGQFVLQPVVPRSSKANTGQTLGDKFIDWSCQGRVGCSAVHFNLKFSPSSAVGTPELKSSNAP